MLNPETYLTQRRTLDVTLDQKVIAALSNTETIHKRKMFDGSVTFPMLHFNYKQKEIWFQCYFIISFIIY